MRRGPAACQAAKGREKAGKKKQAKAAKKAEKTAEKTRAKAHTRDSLQALSKLGELVDGRYRIVSQPPIVVPARDLARRLRHVRRRGRARDPRAVPRLPGHAAGRSAPSAGAIRDRRRGPQGRRCRQRRHPGVHRPAPGTRRSRTRCSCRSRRRPPRCWRTTCRRAATSSTASGWCRGSG